MIKINPTVIKKVLIITLLYILFLLSIIAYNSGNGRYQTFGYEQQQILDTKTGKVSNPQ